MTAILFRILRNNFHENDSLNTQWNTEYNKKIFVSELITLK